MVSWADSFSSELVIYFVLLRLIFSACKNSLRNCVFCRCKLLIHSVSYFRLFASPCTSISTTLIQQIKAFSPPSGCAECQYEVRVASSDSCELAKKSKSSKKSEIKLRVINTYFCEPKVCFLFQLVSATPRSIKANHTSPDGFQGEVMSFTLSPTIEAGGCRVSVSIAALTSKWREINI